MANAGWYPDPTDERVMRYWNGAEWTTERALNVPAEEVARAPAAQVSAFQTFTERFPMTKTAWFVFGGVALAAIGVLMPWEHDTTAVGSISRGPTSAAGGAVLLFTLLAAVVWVAWPSRTEELSKARRISLGVLAAVLGFFVVAKFASLAHASAQAHAQSANADDELFAGLGSMTEISYGPGLGLFVYAAGVLTITIGLTHAWIARVRKSVSGLR
jgi:hypothetical protein